MTKDTEIEVVEAEIVPDIPALAVINEPPPGAVPAPAPELIFTGRLGGERPGGWFTKGGRGHGRYKLIQTEEELQKRIDEYFASCMARRYNENTMREETIWVVPPTMAGLARALGISVATLRNYRHSEDYGPIIQRARGIITEYLETGMLIPGNNPRGYEFQLKNANQGYSDTIHHAVDAPNRLEAARTDEEIQALIDEIPD